MGEYEIQNDQQPDLEPGWNKLQRLTTSQKITNRLQELGDKWN